MNSEVASAMPVQPRAVVTRAAILTTAAEQFARNGFHATSLDEVLTRARVSKGALYFHFESKAALAQAVVDEMVRRWPVVGPTDAAGYPDPLGRLIDLIDEVQQQMADDPIARGGSRLLSDPAPQFGESGRHYARGESNALALLSRAAELGHLRPGADPAVLARQVTALMAGHRQICDALGDRSALRDRVAEAWSVLLPAVATDEWLAAHPERRLFSRGDQG